MTNMQREDFKEDINRVLGPNPDEIDIPTFIRQSESAPQEEEMNQDPDWDMIRKDQELEDKYFKQNYGDKDCKEK